MKTLFGEELAPECNVIALDQYSILRLSGPLIKETAHFFEYEFGTIPESKPKALIINMAEVTEISAPWIRRLVQLQKQLAGINCKVQLVQVSETIERVIKDAGVDWALPISKSIRDALIELKIVGKKQLDVNFVNPFLNAIIQVLSVEARIEARPQGIRLKSEVGDLAGDISGVIGILSNSFRGNVVISFPKETFLKIISNTLGETYTELNPEIESGAAELTNIVLGVAKVTLNECGYGIQSALPSVVRGGQHTVAQAGSGPTIIIPFETDVGPFYTEICLSE